MIDLKEKLDQKGKRSHDLDHMTLTMTFFLCLSEESLCQRVNELSEEKEQYMSDYQHHCKRMYVMALSNLCVHLLMEVSLHRDTLAKFERFRSLRERTMVHELGQTFFMAKTQDAFTICNIILPNADQHDRKLS